MYPLYDALVKRISGKPVDLKQLCTSISSIGQTLPPDQVAEHYREIGALILHHEAVTTGSGGLPYEGKLMIGGKGLLFQVTNLPPLLQQILAEYVENPNLD